MVIYQHTVENLRYQVQRLGKFAFYYLVLVNCLNNMQ